MATVTYFAGRGLVETPRWMLAATQEPFTNVVFTTNAEFEALKASGKLAMGQLPLVEMDGLNLVQSGAIVRYIGRKHGLDGATPEQKALVDIAYESVRDFARVGVDFPFSGLSAEGRVGWDAKNAAACAKYLPRFDAFVARNPDSDTFLVGPSVTLADIALAEALSTLVDITGGDALLAPYPRLVALYAAVLAMPGVDAYLKSPLRFPLGDAAYVVNVDTVLGR